MAFAVRASTVTVWAILPVSVQCFWSFELMSGNPIVFDFTGSMPNATSMGFVQDGLSVTVSTALYNGGSAGNQLPYEFSTPILSTTADGIGGLNPYGDLEAGFDADGKYEVATFSFGQIVRIVSVTLIPLGTRFNLSGENTQFQIFEQGLVLNPATRQTIDATDNTNEISAYGDYLGIAAFTRTDQFRIASITVEAIDLQSVADSFSFIADAGANVLDVLGNDIDDRIITSIDTTGVLGSVTLAADGLTVNYDTGSVFDNLPAGQTVTETFTYTVLGWDGTSETQTVTITITGGSNVINGTASADTLVGTDKRDVITGLAGRDDLSGMGGNDTLDGGADNDRINGNEGNDFIDGGSGNDSLIGADGDDTIVGGIGNDRLSGGNGNDSLDGSVGSDRMFGDDGNDVLVGGTLANNLDGGAGVDTMTGGGGSDNYYVDDTNDQVIELFGGGTDTVYTSANFVFGLNVENAFVVGEAAVNVTGNAQANRMTGNGAANVFTGLGGIDRFDGAAGDDVLIGGTGRDVLTGGSGADSFQFAEFGSSNYDSVIDFNGSEDTILLSGQTFGLAAGVLDTNAFNLGTAATTAAQKIIYDQATGNLYYDSDGNGSRSQQLIANLAGAPTLAFDDLFVF
jgi:VCBS repeat-containing protein